MISQNIAEFSGQICGDQTVLRRPASHREHFAVKEFALEIRRPLDFEIFGFAQSGTRFLGQNHE